MKSCEGAWEQGCYIAVELHVSLVNLPAIHNQKLFRNNYYIICVHHATEKVAKSLAMMLLLCIVTTELTSYQKVWKETGYKATSVK